MKRATLALVCLLWIPFFCLARQTHDSWNNLKQLQPGQKIEVVDIHMKALKGEFVSISDEAISLRYGKNEQSVARGDVVRVSTRDSSHRARNMLILAAVGAGAGLGGGLAIDEGARHVSGEGGSYLYTPVLAAAGAGLGALAGLPTGWRTLYRAEK